MSEAHDASLRIARPTSNQVWISAAEFGEAPAHARGTRRGVVPRAFGAYRARVKATDGPRVRIFPRSPLTMRRSWQAAKGKA